MIIFGPALLMVGIGFLCWLPVTLAVLPPPVYVRLTVGISAIHAGTGALGSIGI